MRQFIGETSKYVISLYKNNKNVLGIFLFGSAARNKFDKHSDIDFFIVLSKKSKFSRVNFVKNKVRVDIIFNTEKEAYQYLKNDKNSMSRITSHMLAYGKILFDTKNTLKKLQKLSINNLKSKTKHCDDDILMHKYSIDDFWEETKRDIEKKDFFAFGLDSQLLIKNIIELFLRMNKQFSRRPDETGRLIYKIDKKFFNLINSFYKTGSIEKRMRALAVLVKYIYQKSGGVLPSSWRIK